MTRLKPLHPIHGKMPRLPLLPAVLAALPLAPLVAVAQNEDPLDDAPMVETELEEQLDGVALNEGLTEPGEFPREPAEGRLYDPTISDSQARLEDDVTEPGAEAGVVPVMATATLLIRAEAVEDAAVYSIAESYDQSFWDAGEPFGPIAADWAELGEVEDLVIDNTGQVQGVTVDVGGFLGIGDKTVLIPLSDMRLIQRPDDEEFYIITRASREMLEEKAEMVGLVGDD